MCARCVLEIEEHKNNVDRYILLIEKNVINKQVVKNILFKKNLLQVLT